MQVVEEKDALWNQLGSVTHGIKPYPYVNGATRALIHTCYDARKKYKTQFKECQPSGITMNFIDEMRTAMQTLREFIDSPHAIAVSTKDEARQERKLMYVDIDRALYVWRMEH